MKINSDTVKLEDADYKNLEAVVEKIAAENKIDNVEEAAIKLSADEGIIQFKIATDVRPVGK